MEGFPVKVPNSTQLAQPWRVHEVLGSFPLEDVWHFPEITGTADEFDDFVALMANGNPAHDGPAAVKFLWIARDTLGKWLGLGKIVGPVDEAPAGSLRLRLPEDLLGTGDDVRFQALPFVPLYKTPTEFAAEIANKTMHGVMHLGWLESANGTYSPQMAVYVRPKGVFGRAYMRFIKPFRYWIVYPALEKQGLRRWRRRASPA
jgi:hypothetical protein